MTQQVQETLKGWKRGRTTVVTDLAPIQKPFVLFGIAAALALFAAIYYGLKFIAVKKMRLQ